MGVLGTIHTGLTVRDLTRMLAFFGQALGAEVGEIRQIPIGDTLGHITGVPGAQARVCMVTLPGGHVVELLEYAEPASATTVAPRPCDVGAAHLALHVVSVADTAIRSETFGFTVAGQLQCLAGGPFAGHWVAYLRDGDGFTLELIGGA